LPPVREEEKIPGERIGLHLGDDQCVEPVVLLSHVRRLHVAAGGGQAVVDALGEADSKLSRAMPSVNRASALEAVANQHGIDMQSIMERAK